MGGESIVVRRSEHGGQAGDEHAADLTGAIVLADLLAAELGRPAGPPAGPPRHGAPEYGAGGEEGEAARLAVTVAQLEHALAARPLITPGDHPHAVDNNGITISGTGQRVAASTAGRPPHDCQARFAVTVVTERH